MEKTIIEKDGQKCEITTKNLVNGMVMKTKGKGCKKILGDEYFDKIKMEIPDF